MTRPLRVTLLSYALWMLAIVPARALDESSTAAATVLFDEAIALMDRGRYAEACPKLARSQELAPSGGTLLNLAKCYEKNSQIASAWSRYSEAAERAAAAGKPEMEKLARDAAKKLEPLVSQVVVRLREPTPDIEVRRDGEIVTASELGVPMPVDPGEHSIEATAPGRVAWRSTLSVPQTKSSLVVEIPKLQPVPVRKQASGADTRDRRPRSHQRTIGIGVGAAGLVGIGIGTYFGLRASSKNDEAKQHCRTDTLCDEQGLALDDQARSAATASTIGFIAGGALLTAGAVLFFTAPDGERAAVGVGLDPSGARLSIGRRF